MPGRLNEVDARMHAIVHNVHAVDLIFSVKISIETLLNVLNNRSPGIIIVDEIAEAGSIHYGETETNAVLFDIRADGLYGNRFWLNVYAGPFALLRRIQGGVEEGVDQGRFPKTRFT